jgi:hypothetical protein
MYPDPHTAPTCGNQTQRDYLRRNLSAWRADDQAEGAWIAYAACWTCRDPARMIYRIDDTQPGRLPA